MRRNMPRGLGKFWVLVLIVLAPVTGPSLTLFSSPSDKLKLDDLIARHLMSIGSREARASVKTRIISGSSQVVLSLSKA